LKIRTINGLRLHKGFAAGAHHVLRQQNELNRMNVYPVPDGDTGTNLAATVQSVYEGTSVTRSVSQTSSSMADAALTGARGNSGLIMAQFLYGFARESEGRDVLDVSHFGKAVSGAVPYAEEALDKPVEGTILTVMREWASEVRSIASRTKDFAMLFPGSLDVARRSLMETPSKLPVLAKAGVVDAGAQGFVNFLEGIVDFLQTGDARMFSRKGDVFSQEQFHEEFLDADPAYRFCTEALINGDNLDISGIRGDMAPFGDSLIVGGHQQRVRVHIHTDEPDRMFFTIRNRGAIKQQKADDMKRQVDACHRRKHSVALVTDSTCDLPKELMDEHQIHMVPLRIAFGESVYLDKVTISPSQFYSLLEESSHYPVTSQAGVTDFEKTYRFLLDHYDTVIALHLSSALSGMWNASRAAAEKVGGDIRVIDSRIASAPLGLMVLKAARALDNGAGADEICAMLEKDVTNARVFVSLRTVRYMVKGGRISPLKGFAAKMLGLKPMITVDSEGRAVPFGKSRSWKANITNIVSAVEKISEEHPLWEYAIVHLSASVAVQQAAVEMEKRTGKPPAYITEISPVLGAHSGPGSVAIGVVCE